MSMGAFDVGGMGRSGQVALERAVADGFDTRSRIVKAVKLVACDRAGRGCGLSPCAVEEVAKQAVRSLTMGRCWIADAADAWLSWERRETQ